MIAGIKTLDTSIIGAIIISGLVTAIHNRFFDKPLPVFLGIFGAPRLSLSSRSSSRSPAHG